MAYEIVQGQALKTMRAQGCPCDGGKQGKGPRPTVAVVLQLATLGRNPRVRTRAVTIRMHALCARRILTPRASLVREALAQAIAVQAMELENRVFVDDEKAG